MEKLLVIDERMRNIEKDYFINNGYKLIEVIASNDIYDEISSHVDIFSCRLNNNIVLEKSLYNNVLKYKTKDIYCGDSILKSKYPFDIPYNVCKIGKYVIHNFKYTDKKILDVIHKEKLEMININQGYSKCSIAVVDDNSAITTDIAIYNKLKENNIDVLLIKEKLDIKLLNKEKRYSSMSGFIGGCTAKIDNKFIIFGDIDKIDKEGKIKKFIKSKNIELVYFKNLDVIDYGGILAI